MDQLELEKLGIPTVTIATTEFASLARDTAFGQGAEPSFVVVPHPMGMISLAEIRKKAESVFPEILKAATEWQPVVKPTLLAKPAYPAERLKLKGTVGNINAIFFSRGLSLGIPIIPPTPELVGEMLKGTSRRPEEVVGTGATEDGGPHH